MNSLKDGEVLHYFLRPHIEINENKNTLYEGK